MTPNEWFAPNPRLQRTRSALLRSPLSDRPLGNRNLSRVGQVGFRDADGWANWPFPVLFLQQRGHRAAAHPRSAGAQNRQILAESGDLGLDRPLFGFRTAVD